MKNKPAISAALAVLAAVLVFSSCGTGSEPSINTAFKQEYVEGELIVKFKGNIPLSKAQAFHKSVGAFVEHGYPSIGAELIKLPIGLSVENAVQAYTSNPSVEYAEPNFIVHKAVIPNDTYFDYHNSGVDAGQWGLYNYGQTIKGVAVTPLADINATAAWDIHNGVGSVANVVVAVVDTGVDYNHLDLAGNIWSNPGEICGDVIDNDGNGFVDDCIGWNFSYGTNDPLDDDNDSHGTHVAGTIGAICNNGIGVCGVNWSVKIIPVKVLNSSGYGSMDNVIMGVLYAVQNGAKYINASYTYEGSPSAAERDSINTANNNGVLFIAAAGNFGSDNDTYPAYPAGHMLPNIISVGASDYTDTKASFSDYGEDSVHVFAPGVNIFSTIISNKITYAISGIMGYGFLAGTSMAAPHVTGLASLVASYKPWLTHLEVKETILSSADKKPQLAGFAASAGRINAYDALVFDINAVAPFKPTKLSPSVTGSSTISLNWVDNSTREDGFKLERKDGSGGVFNMIANFPANAVSYTDTGLVEGQSYFYKIKSFNSFGDSEYSKMKGVTIPLNAPSNFTAVGIVNNAIRLRWSDNSLQETGFMIERRDQNSSSFILVASVISNTVEYLDYAIVPNQAYYYRIRAYNSVANSVYTTVVSASTESTVGTGTVFSEAGCFIATAAYGSYLAPEVMTLRRFRDEYLLTNETGRGLVRLYYEYSPPAAGYIARHETLRAVSRAVLAPVVFSVKHPSAGFSIALGALLLGLVRIRRGKNDSR